MYRIGLLCLIASLFTACMPEHHGGHHPNAADLGEKYIGGHLYRAGRHIHHHPEWRKHHSESESDKKE